MNSAKIPTTLKVFSTVGGTLLTLIASATEPVPTAPSNVSPVANVVAAQTASRESPAQSYNALIAKHYSGCKRVFTGNSGGTTGVDQQYMAVMGLNFLRQMCRCEESPIKRALLRPVNGDRDVLSQSHFQLKHSGISDGNDDGKRLVNLYSVLYSLGQRESSGDFSAGPDSTAWWFSVASKRRAWEAGAFQASADSLALDGDSSSKSMPQSNPLPKQIFMNYLRVLMNASATDKQLACDLNVLAKSRASSGTDVTGGTLQKLFKGGGTCSMAMAHAMTRNSANPVIGVDSREGKTIDCFRSLQQNCPAFDIEYAAVVTRLNRKHWGPLLSHDETKKDRPYIVPGCSKFFEEMYTRKNQFCELADSRSEIPAHDVPPADGVSPTGVPLLPGNPILPGDPGTLVPPPVGAPGVGAGDMPPPPGGVAVPAAKDHNSVITNVIANTLPKGKKFGLDTSETVTSLHNSISNQGGKLLVDSDKVTSGNCATGTYMALMGALSAEQAGGLKIDARAVQALMPTGHQPDGVGFWGRWNANGPGAAVAFKELGLGKNFVDSSIDKVNGAVSDRPRAGDFMKIFWTSGKDGGDVIGKGEHGHMTVFTRYITAENGEITHVCFWTASAAGGTNNFAGGFGEKCVARSTIKHAIFSRLEHPENINKVTGIARENTYLSDNMVNKENTFEDALRMSGALTK